MLNVITRNWFKGREAKLYDKTGYKKVKVTTESIKGDDKRIKDSTINSKIIEEKVHN